MKDSTGNSYFVNQELIEEMVRLNTQANLVTNAMEGVLPEQDEQMLLGVHDVLDLACGPGEWVMRVAAAFFASPSKKADFLRMPYISDISICGAMSG
jgi:hypothetical protein